MSKRISWMIVLSTMFGLTGAYGQGQQVRAQDGSFNAQIPFGWTATSAVFQNFTASSPSGESITVGSDDVLEDAQSLLNARVACQQQGAGCQFQYWSPRLSPVDIVRSLFPKYAPSLQSVQILGVWPLDVAGFQGSLVRYKFLMDGTPKEGFAEVFSLPGVATQQLRYWSFVAATAAGPRQSFRSNLPLYASILDSIHYNQQALDTIAQAPLRFGEKLRQINREWGKAWIAVLGGDVRYPCSDCLGEQGTIRRDDLPTDRFKYDFYVCGKELWYTPHGSPAPCPYGKKIELNY